MAGADDETIIAENAELLLARLLDDEPPDDWAMPTAVMLRTGHLEAAAVLAGQTTLDALAHVQEARRSSLAP
jgi:hypothetical protein